MSRFILAFRMTGECSVCMLNSCASTVILLFSVVYRGSSKKLEYSPEKAFGLRESIEHAVVATLVLADLLEKDFGREGVFKNFPCSHPGIVMNY